MYTTVQSALIAVSTVAGWHLYFLLMPRSATPVIVPPADASKLRAILKKGIHKSRKITRARVLLLMGAGKGAAAVQAEVGVGASQYYQLKRRYLAGGLPEALEERARSGQPPKVTPAVEAIITGLACSDSPVGTTRWTLSLLNEAVVALECVEQLSKESIRKVLKKANSSPG